MIISLLIYAAMLNPQESAVWTREPSTGLANTNYILNRAPLVPNAFNPLPIGAIKPGGWLRKQLELESEGFTGRLTEISPFLKKEGNAWLAKDGKGDHAWEEVPYWLKGFSVLGYVLGNKRIIDEAQIWIDATLNSQRESGYFGPESNLTAHDHRADIWPNMIMLDVIRTYHDFSGDSRVIPFMTRYFRWVLTIPDEDMFPSYWEKHRGGDMMNVAIWLYNRTGDPTLLDVCRKIHRVGADWSSGVANLHGVNFAQAFREPATFYQVSKNPRDLAATERNYKEIRRRFGQVPGGLWGADENAREGFSDPRQAAETCTMAEMILLGERLLFQTGEATWAERCEDVAFNSLPASMTSDLKALRYLTSPNMVISDRISKSPGLQNSGPMTCMDPNDHRCCQHNVSHAWPYFAEHLWAGTSDNGLLAAFYSESEVRAKVGDGTSVTIREDTNYPFGETIRFTIDPDSKVEFPLLLRVPSWASKPEVKLNGTRLALSGFPGPYLRIKRQWSKGDVVELRLPMEIKVIDWPGQRNARSINYGPMTFSLKIGEKMVRSGGSDSWPAFDILPTTPWNYGLPTCSIEISVIKKPFPKNNQPYDPKHTPIELKTVARRIPQWEMDSRGLPGLLQDSPAKTNASLETVTLIPMGASRLRVSQFPTVTNSPTGIAWTAPPKAKKSIPATASFKNDFDPINALTDGLEPKDSGDESIPRFTWWNHTGGSEWVALQLPKETQVAELSIYWFDDRRNGGRCRVPDSWTLEFLNSKGEWQPVEAHNSFETRLDTYSRVAFKPVRTKSLRVTAKLQPAMSGGILELKIRG